MCATSMSDWFSWDVLFKSSSKYSIQLFNCSYSTLIGFLFLVITSRSGLLSFPLNLIASYNPLIIPSPVAYFAVIVRSSTYFRSSGASIIRDL